MDKARDVERVDVDPRPFDIPWMVLDSAAAARAWNWTPTRSVESIMAEIGSCLHAVV